MSILQDLAAIGANIEDSASVTRAILSLAAAPSARVALAREWSEATGLQLTTHDFARLNAP